MVFCFMTIIGNFCVRFEVFTAVTMKNVVFWDVTPSDSCYIRVSEERIASIMRVTRIGELGVMLAVTSNRCTLRNIQEDVILCSGRG
jgi:hypothetical protein